MAVTLPLVPAKIQNLEQIHLDSVTAQLAVHPCQWKDAAMTFQSPLTRTTRAWCAALVLCGAGLAWAQVTPPQDQPRGWWRAVAPPKPPVRLVSLAPSVTEMLFALDLGPRVVGVTRYCDKPAAAAALPKVGGFSDPSLEAILALKPDAVVGVPAEANRKVVDRLVELGVPVLVVPDTTLQDVFVALRTLGDQLDARPKADVVVATMQRELDAVALRVKGKAAPRVLILYDHRPVIVAGKGSFADGVLPLAGGINVVTEGAVAYPTLSLETVARLKPDVIIDASMGARSAAGLDATRDLLGRLTSVPAVKNNRLYVLAPGVLMRPGPTLARDVEILAGLLHGPPVEPAPR